MTNVTDTKADLEPVAVGGITNQWKNSNTGAGAGANANLTADPMRFVESDTLAELVWSPRAGLRIKFADKKPCCAWEVGPSDMGLLESENNISKGCSVASRATCHASGEVAKPCTSVNTVRSTNHCNTGPQDQTTDGPLSKHMFEGGMTSGVDRSGSDRPSSKMEAMMPCVLQGHILMDDVRMEKNGCFINSFHENAQNAIMENVESTEEGDLFRTEKSFYCCENDENREIESHGSMESCKSANLVTKRTRRLSFEQQLILGSKRIKKQAQEYAVKKDSSFMNWISNMVNGLQKHENYDRRISVCDENQSLETRKTGFKNVFQSLFLQDVKAQETITHIEEKFVGSSNKMNSADKCSHRSVDCLEIKENEAEGLVKHISLYERVTTEAPTEMFDTIRSLRLSRTDILKWADSRLSVAHLVGFFVRLRLAKSKWEEEVVGSRYYVACITGLQGSENPWKGIKQPIRVKVGGVECFVESQYISNCTFLEEELVAWWQKTSKNGGTPLIKDLKSKLAERKRLGL